MTGPLPALDDTANSDEATAPIEMPTPKCQQCQTVSVAGPKTNLCQHCQATLTADARQPQLAGESRTHEPAGESPSDVIEFALVTSPYRPFPLEAKRRLRECADTVVFGDGESTDHRGETAYLTDLPSHDLVERFELHIPRDPEERWKTDRGETINIYPDRVIANGTEQNLDPADAQARVRSSDRFTPLSPASESVSENSPTQPSHPSESQS